MSSYFVCSDLHLGDEFMAKLRGYDSFDAYWLELKLAWNSAVPADGHVLMLGDICMKNSSTSMLHELNGRKTLIAGNHCSPMSLHALHWVPMLLWPSLKCILSHIPVHPGSFKHKAHWVQLHGHTHSVCYGRPYINVCPEQIGLAPIKVADALQLEQLQCN